MSYKPFTTKYTWQIIDDIKEYLEELQAINKQVEELGWK